MILAMLLAAAEPQTAIDAERAFAADAQAKGQWTAFRAYALPGAVMFTPKAIYAHEFLRNRKDPPRSLRWQPSQSFLSCDGAVAVNVGPWQGAGSAQGYFTTVWLRQTEGWRWAYDGGDSLKVSIKAPTKAVVRRASCRGIPAVAPSGYWQIATLPSPDAPAPGLAHEYSADRSLLYDYKVGANGERSFHAYLWNGRGYVRVIDQRIYGSQ
jgi:hypothetical protein